MKPDELLRYAQGMQGFSSMESCYLNIDDYEKVAILDREIVFRKLREFKPNCGWLNLQSEILSFHGGNIPDLETQILLCGEMVNANGQSLHIRENGFGQLIFTILEDSLDQPADSLSETISFLSHEQPDLPGGYFRIEYKRYWQLQEAIGYHIAAARFTGFSQEGKTK